MPDPPRWLTATLTLSMIRPWDRPHARNGRASTVHVEAATRPGGKGVSVSASSNRHTANAALRRPGVWLAMVGVFLLSACGAEIDGIAGVTVDSNGHAQALVQNCKRPMYGGVLFWTDDPRGADGPIPKLGRWTFSRSTVGKPITWPVDATHADDVRATIPIKAMLPGRTYTLGAGTKDALWSTVGVDFTLNDLKALKPGRVLISTAGEHPREVSVAQFSDHACDHS
jgi:hypothetical protein